jgi:tetratricopeptide (TPR) repeat protein
LIPAGKLLAMDAQAFFRGTPTEVESRYAQAWALCLLAIREKPVGELLRQAIDARVRAAPRLDVEARLDQLYAAFIKDPWGLKVTKDQVWADAERFYGIDKIFVGALYAWAYVVDPSELKALIYLGDALFAAANLPASLQQYEAGQRRHERSALPALRIGDVYAQMGEVEQARQLWNKAVDSRAEGPDEQAYRALAKQRLAGLPR